MNWNTDQVIDRVRKHHSLKEGDMFGVVSGIAKDVRIAKSADGDEVVSIINTAAIDLSNEVVIPSGCTDKSYMEKNGKVFADHQYDIEHTVGWLRHPIAPYPSSASHRGWKARAGLHSEKPIAKDIRLIIEESGSIGVSIGFIPLDRGSPTEQELELYGKGGRTIDTIIREWKLFEFSYTCLPCNVECQTLRTTVDDSKIADCERLVTIGKISRESAAALGIPGVTAKRKLFPVEQVQRVIDASGVVLHRRAAS